MIKKIMSILSVIWVITHSTALAASSGLYFSVAVNPVGVNKTTLTINTKTPSWFYQFAGIKIRTPGYTLAGNTLPSGNGYYLFPVSDTQPAQLVLKGEPGNVTINLCLNGIGQTSGCETVTISIVVNSPILTSYSVSTGATTGANFTPGLGAVGSVHLTFYGFPTISPGVCATNSTHSYPGIPATILSDTSIATLPGFPEACLALCNSSVTATSYPGQSAKCTNIIPLT